MEVERSWQQAAQRIQAVIDVARQAEKMILTTQRNRHRLDIGSGEDSSVASEFAASAQQLLAQKQLGQQALSLGESDTVYWLRMPPSPPPSSSQPHSQRKAESSQASAQSTESVPVLYAQLVQTASLLKRLLLTEGSSTIFAGTALSVDNSFGFARGRFSLDSDVCPALSVVTEHHEQTLLYLPDDVPEPNSPQYQRHLDDALIQLATTLEGQLVALFTSHAALRSSYATIKPLLETRGILVLGQGVDGSPRQLWQVFQKQERVVLLGTGSFWDAAEEVVRSPKCIFIARLPMPVLNDPPIAARADHYSDQLHQLTVPVASLRVRRVLNRLAWADPKRNAVVLFDRRVISKEYGSTVLHSLPRCSQRQAAVSHMPETIVDWLTGTGAWE
jgi:Rad3-related DNA helicase